jgi:hypothetical protein
MPDGDGVAVGRGGGASLLLADAGKIGAQRVVGLACDIAVRQRRISALVWLRRLAAWRRRRAGPRGTRGVGECSVRRGAADDLLDAPA